MNAKHSTTVDNEVMLCAGLQFLSRTGNLSSSISPQMQQNIELQDGLHTDEQQCHKEYKTHENVPLRTLLDAVKKAEVCDLPCHCEKKPSVGMKRRGAVCETSTLERNGLTLVMKQYMQMKNLRKYCLL